MILPIILLILWIAALVFFKRLNLHFFFFLFGSIGLFFFLMYAGLGSLEKRLEFMITYAIGLLGKVTHFWTAYPQYSMLTTYHKSQALTFFVDYECSGIVETMVYICLLLFYPAYRWMMKAWYTFAGIAYIFAANVFRVFLICVIARVFGPELFFFSHTIFARIVFFLLMIVLYYFVFTRPHIKTQKVGDLSNADE